MKQELSNKEKIEQTVYGASSMVLFAFSLIILAGVILTLGGTFIQLLFN